MKPLIFFVHVPKTAGSTINSYLKDALPNGLAHVEQIVDKPSFADVANSADWLSGHVGLAQATARLTTVTQRPIRFFTCMREPSRQVMSHYNWLIEIFHRGGQFYEGNPPYIKALSEQIRANSETPEQIVGVLREHHGLFLNCQSFAVLGPLGHGQAVSERLQNVARYEMIGSEASLDRLVSRMIGRRVKVDRSDNESRYHFDRKLFSSPDVTAFLRHANEQDELLYRRITAPPSWRDWLASLLRPQTITSAPTP